MVSDPFKVKDSTYDSSINSFIYRVFNDLTGELANITISDRAGSKESTSYISFVSDNSKEKITEIVELNKPAEAESYKAIFDSKASVPNKIFHKKNIEDKWQQLVSPSKNIVDYIAEERSKLKSRRIKRESETSTVYVTR
jgi:hypothetical protein